MMLHRQPPLGAMTMHELYLPLILPKFPTKIKYVKLKSIKKNIIISEAMG
jgi:hypothetical protein